MTAERSRTPMIRAVRTAGYGHDDYTSTDLFGLMLAEAPHPDFAARAAIWRDQGAGLISIAEARRLSAAVGQASPPTDSSPVATRGQGSRPAPRPRHARPAPNASRQYAQPMATTAARDDRLTPQAKAFLQVIAARCGRGRETTLTKGTAGAIMSRSPRTIRRYLVDLIRFGYIETETRMNGKGLHLGLVVRITDLVRPFYEDARGLARWLAETPAAAFAPFTGHVSTGEARVSLLTPKNQPSKNLSLGRPAMRAAERLLSRFRGAGRAPS